MCNKKIIRHGLSKTRLHTIWHSMYCRCYYPQTNQYKHYGGKGIQVCEEWKNNFLNFYNWAMANGYRDDLTIDRIDNDKNYCPENCKWSTYKEQYSNKTNNRFITFNDTTATLTEWSKIYNINITTLSDRLKSGMSFEEAITKPIYKSGGYLIFTINNETKMLSDWCKEYNMKYSTAFHRIKSGWDIERALTVAPKKCNILTRD